MTGQLSGCFEAFRPIEAERNLVLTQLEGWSAERLRFRPTPKAWSAIEVLDHVVRAETGTIADVQAGLQNPRILGSELRPRVEELDRALRSEQFFLVPAGAEAIHPDAQTTWPQVVLRWQHARTEARSLLEGLTPAHACCGVFCHPFAGWMTVHEVLEHFSAHLCHHRFQLRRIRAAWEGQ